MSIYAPYKYGDLRPLADIEFEYLEAQLNKIGKHFFVEHYYAFKQKNRLVFDKCPSNMKADTFKQRVLAAFSIFDSKLELHALYTVINSPQLPKETITAARQIFEYERFMSDYIQKSESHSSLIY